MYFTWFLMRELVGGELTMGQNHWLPLAPIPFFHQKNHAFSAMCYICRLKPVKPVFWSTNQPWDICTRFKHYLHSTEWSCIINYHTHSLQTRSTKMPHTKQRIEWHPFVGKGEPLLLKIWQEKNPWALLQPGGGGGTLRISGWGCAAGPLEPLTYTRASSAEFCYPILE